MTGVSAGHPGAICFPGSRANAGLPSRTTTPTVSRAQLLEEPQANKTAVKPSTHMPYGSDIRSRRRRHSRLRAHPQLGFHSQQGPQHSEWPKGCPQEGHSCPPALKTWEGLSPLSRPCSRQVGRLESAPGRQVCLRRNGFSFL